MNSVHLICLKESDPSVVQAITGLWPHGRHYQLNETQFLVAKPSNGGKSVYERIKGEVGREFAALIVRFQGGYHGRHNTDLWEWLQTHVSR